MHRIDTSRSYPLYGVSGTRAIEQAATTGLAPHALMQRAGLAVARLALALAPHARSVWVACGPGNNGGDGFEAALQLKLRGVAAIVTWTGPPPGKPHAPDAAAARMRALAAGVEVTAEAPPDFDFCIDALLGLGAALNPAREGNAQIVQWLQAMQASDAPRLSVDLPSGLDADTGVTSAVLRGDTVNPAVAIDSGAACARPRSMKRTFCLSLLTLKPGLFTSEGRDHAGEIWFDDLGSASLPGLPSARARSDGELANGSFAPVAGLLGQDSVTSTARSRAAHRSHKGSFGDVAVVGGESDPQHGNHMTGAALLAARAALHAGAGRVYVALLGADSLTVDPQQPELMFRHQSAIDFSAMSVVCGCGGGAAIKAALPRILSTSGPLVIDADALNALVTDSALQALLKARGKRLMPTVLTPHPLEAARLLCTTAVAVQLDRLATAGQLAAQFGCVVVLKGSGTVIAAPGEIPVINSTGNALLATAGTGDVLAGMLGAGLAGLSSRQTGSENAFSIACSVVFSHGLLADRWRRERPGQALTASALACGAFDAVGA